MSNNDDATHGNETYIDTSHNNYCYHVGKYGGPHGTSVSGSQVARRHARAPAAPRLQ